jgi:hypothetical protein
MQHQISSLIFSCVGWPILHDRMEYFGAEVQGIEMTSFREDFNECKSER